MDPSNVIALFVDTIRSDWEGAEAQDEWLFARLVEKIVGPLDSAAAFAAIDEIIPVLLVETHPYLRERSGQLLMALARRTDTTEMPPSLKRSWTEITQLLQTHASVLADLTSWYRVDGIAERKEPNRISEVNKLTGN